MYGEEDVTAKLNSDAENERRMDIFLCNTRNIETTFETTLEENIVVELKAPRVLLTKKYYAKYEDYMVTLEDSLNSIVNYGNGSLLPYVKK